MAIAVTGGAGFIGSHFIRAWMNAHPGDSVVNLDQLTYAGSRERLSDLEGRPGYCFLCGDVANPKDVRRALEGAEAVVHFAAETHVDRSITDAAPFLRTNVEGTAVVLEAARDAKAPKVLHVSTDEVYGPVAKGAVDESAALAPRSPYAASKAGADLLAQAYIKTYEMPVVIARPTNIYGPAQLPEKFMPLAITHAMEKRPIPIYGDGQQRRGWLFVTDLCDALITLLERGKTGEVYNVASGREMSNLETARGILAELEASEDLLQFVKDRPAHDRRYAMTDEKLRALGWKAMTPFDEGLARTVAWYRENVFWWRPLARKLREDSYHWLNRPARSGAGRATRADR